MRKAAWAAIMISVIVISPPERARAQRRTTPDLEMLLDLDLFVPQPTGNAQTGDLAPLIEQLNEMRAIGLFASNTPPPQRSQQQQQEEEGR